MHRISTSLLALPFAIVSLSPSACAQGTCNMFGCSSCGQCSMFGCPDCGGRDSGLGYPSMPSMGDSYRGGGSSGRCWQEVDYINPDYLQCYQMGTSRMGVPIWQCCDDY